MSYRECGAKEAWAIEGDDPSLSEAAAMYDDCDVAKCSEAGLYVELNGNVSPRGRYGHLGMYPHALIVERMFYVARTAPAGCE